MIAGGVCAIILFRGFSHRILYDLRETTIRTQTGHLQLATPAYWNKSVKRAKDGLLPHYRPLLESIKKLPHVTEATGRLSLYGLVSSGDQSLSAQGLSLDPRTEQGKNASLRMVAGTSLKADRPNTILLGSGLAKRLGITVGEMVTVLTYTYDGMMNAIDLELSGIFNSGLSEIDDNTFILPLSEAAKLLDSDKVEKIVVSLDDTRNTNSVRLDLEALMKKIEPGVQVKTWLDLAEYYRQARDFFGTQNKVIQIIILILVLLGVLNTIGMSVFERAGEIGTLRALGEREEIVLYQFLLEGAILGVIGSLSGLILGVLSARFVGYLNIPITVPGATAPLRVQITLFAAAFWQAVLLAMIATVIAALVPAYKASRTNIAEALKKNI